MIRHSSMRVPAPWSVRTGRILAAIILLSFLLFGSGWVWAVTMNSPTSYLLDSQRMLTHPDANAWSYYTSSQDIAAAFWLRPQLTGGRSLCSDYWTRNNVMTSYGGIPRKSHSVLTYYLPDECDFRQAFVFLSVFNTIYGVGSRISEINGTWSISQISPQLFGEDIVYSNGGSTIYVYSG